MSEADRLREDVNRMMQGLAPLRQSEGREEDEEVDLDEVKDEIRSEMYDKLKNIIETTFTQDAIVRMMSPEHLQQIGNVGANDVAGRLVMNLLRGFEDGYENDYGN